MSCIDKENTKVTMSLKDYEVLANYEKAYRVLQNEIRKLVYIDGITTDSATIIINKKALEQFIYPFAERDCELDGLEESLIFKWK